MAAAPFNDAFVGTAGGDSKPLCSTTHPYSDDDATTGSNAGSSALSATSIEATRRLAHTSILNDRGQLMGIEYDTILCTVANEQKANEIMKSSLKVDTANNNYNFQKGRFDIIVWDKLSSNYPWFMIDTAMGKNFLIWWDRIKTEFNHDKDFDTYQQKWSVYFRCATQFAGWQWIYGHNATA